MRKASVEAIVVGLSVAAMAVALPSAGAGAAIPTLAAGCTQAGVGGRVTCVYDAAGEHSFAIPKGVTTVDVVAVGAPGGNAWPNYFGGAGATERR